MTFKRFLIPSMTHIYSKYFKQNKFYYLTMNKKINDEGYYITATVKKLLYFIIIDHSENDKYRKLRNLRLEKIIGFLSENKIKNYRMFHYNKASCHSRA